MSAICKLLLFIFISISSQVIASVGAYTPAEFVYTAEINLPQQNQALPFYQFALPLEVYRTTMQPDLSDLTVFDQAGQIMPHALINKRPQVVKQVSFTRFELTVPNLESKDKQIRIQSANGLSIILPNDFISQTKDNKKIWLLSPISNQQGQENISQSELQQLLLQWRGEQQSWQANASIFISEDLQQWRSLVNQFNIMELYADNNKLQVNQIPLTARTGINHEPKPYYLLLLIESGQNYLPELINVTAQEKTLLSSEMIEIPFDKKMLSEHEVEYQLPFGKFLSGLKLQPLQPQTVLPISIRLRSAKNNSWSEYPAMTLYSMISQQSEGINQLKLSNQLVQGVIIKSNLNLNSPYTPEVFGQRSALTLVFNAQGQGPFILAWANKNKQQSPMTIEQLIPPNWLMDKDYFSLPNAQLSDNIVVNDKVLRSFDKDNQPPTDYSIWIWGGLVIAVFLLVLFTLRIVREMRKGASPS